MNLLGQGWVEIRRQQGKSARNKLQAGLESSILLKWHYPGYEKLKISAMLALTAKSRKQSPGEYEIDS